MRSTRPLFASTCLRTGPTTPELLSPALARVLRLLEDAAAEVPEVQKVPPPRALFTGFGDSSLDFRLFAWVESVDIGVQAQNGLRMAIPRTLDATGIAIPFPQRDLHIRYAPPGIDMAATLKT